MGQRSKNHLTLAKEKKEDEMGWQKGQALGWPLSRQVALLAQDLLPFGTGGRGAQKSSSPSPTPFDPLLTRCVEGLYQVPPGFGSIVGEFVVGGVLCPEVCGGWSSRQHWGPAPGLRGGEHGRQVPGLALGHDTS